MPLKAIRAILSSNYPIMEHFLKCSLCIGTWVGIVYSALLIDTLPLYVVLCIPAASASISWFVDSSTQCVQMIEKALKEEERD